MMYLSKSKYVAGMQCPKILWMDKYMPEQKAQQDDSRMLVGHTVGVVARGYFGAYTEVPANPADMKGMVAETRRLLEAGTQVIAEAAFFYNGNFCIVDILRKVAGGYEIVEVKSASGTKDDTPKQIMSKYGDDLAYQYYVLTACGMNVNKISLLRLNKAYVRQGELDLHRLFVLTDCTALVKAARDTVAQNIAAILSVAGRSSSNEPEMLIDSRCKGCAYERRCFRRLPENNVFTIGWGMRGSKKDKIYQSGIVSFDDVLNSATPLNDRQLRQVRTAVMHLAPHIEPHEVRRFLSALSYPLYYLDFETYTKAIPLYNGIQPYQQIPFQYSVHIQHTPGAEPLHREFLAKEGEDSRRSVAERLCADVPDNVCVLAYFAGFEKSCIRALADTFPDLKKHLMGIHDNIRDLAEPFYKGHYYCREMGGGYSIKSVLPALCGDDPALDYKKLELIQHGGDAMNAFATLHEKPPQEVKKLREALLAYCKMDTLAMVRVLARLYECVQ